MKAAWKTQKCSGCDGHGMVALYSAYDFEGATECSVCGGSGTEWVSPTGRTAQYPGGPFTGRIARTEGGAE